MKKPFYSIGIIFKNEIRCLERCMKSLQPLREAVPCELVMADTGADDGSREIAEKYADILFDFPWINDFSCSVTRFLIKRDKIFKKNLVPLGGVIGSKNATKSPLTCADRPHEGERPE